jgi:hypothetical protein
LDLLLHFFIGPEYLRFLIIDTNDMQAFGALKGLRGATGHKTRDAPLDGGQ